MSVEERICDYCKDVILGSKEDVILIQKGYINKYNEFQALGKNEVRHERCHRLIEARAIVMADISNQLAVPDFSKRVKEVLDRELSK